MILIIGSDFSETVEKSKAFIPNPAAHNSGDNNAREQWN